MPNGRDGTRAHATSEGYNSVTEFSEPSNKNFAADVMPSYTYRENSRLYVNGKENNRSRAIVKSYIFPRFVRLHLHKHG